MRVRSVVITLVSLAASVALSGCGGGSPPSAPPASTSPAPSSSAPAPPPATSPPSRATSAPTPDPTTELGIDASHHQGPIDWARVADHGVSFAYLKATEGTGFTDPRFAEHRVAAVRQGIAVAGYHYFQLCSDGAAQADHFIDVLGPDGPDGADALAPALDLELAGSCTTPPAREVLLAEVREFLEIVDARYDTSTVVYLYPELEERFGFATALDDHPQWVRRLGKQPPRRPWQVWQYDDRGSVPGISGGVDLNRRLLAP